MKVYKFGRVSKWESPTVSGGKKKHPLHYVWLHRREGKGREEKIARTGEGKRRRKEIFPSVFGYRGKRKERKEIKKDFFDIYPSNFKLIITYEDIKVISHKNKIKIFKEIKLIFWIWRESK